jgi:hypothetical protein
VCSSRLPVCFANHGFLALCHLLVLWHPSPRLSGALGAAHSWLTFAMCHSSSLCYRELRSQRLLLNLLGPFLRGPPFLHGMSFSLLIRLCEQLPSCTAEHLSCPVMPSPAWSLHAWSTVSSQAEFGSMPCLGVTPHGILQRPEYRAECIGSWLKMWTCTCLRLGTRLDWFQRMFCPCTHAFGKGSCLHAPGKRSS